MTYVFLVVSNPIQASDTVYVNSRRGRLNLVHGGFILRICSSGVCTCVLSWSRALPLAMDLERARSFVAAASLQLHHVFHVIYP